MTRVTAIVGHLWGCHPCFYLNRWKAPFRPSDDGQGDRRCSPGAVQRSTTSNRSAFSGYCGIGWQTADAILAHGEIAETQRCAWDCQ